LLSQKNGNPTLQQKSVRGIKWQISTEVLARAIRLATMFVLAHLLLPADFGLIGMALIFTQLAYVLFDLGLSVPLIQKKDLQPIHYQTTFTIFLVLALIFYSLLFLFAPLIAQFFKNDQLIAILRWLSLVFFLYAFRGIPSVRLTKQLRFRALGILQLSSTLIYALIAASMAVMGFGVWSFVLAIIGQEVVFTLGSIVVLKEWYGLKFSRAALAELSSFGGTVFLTRIVGYLNVNLPNIVIGRWLGETALGYYSVGYQLVDFPVQRISKNVLRVMFPTFSRVQDQPLEFNRLYQETVRGILLVILPLFTGMAFIAPEFVQIFYGDKWRPLIPILQILTVVGLARSLWTLASVVVLAKGKPEKELKMNLIYFVLLTLVLFVSLFHGLLMVVTGVAIVIFALTVLFLIQSTKLMQFPLPQWIKTVRTSVVSSFVMAASLWLVRILIPQAVGVAGRLILLFVVGIVVYFLSAFLLEPGLKNYLAKFLGRGTK